MRQLEKLLGGSIRVICVGREADRRQERLVFPGSFNPLHSGHEGMAKVAAERTGKQVDFEISAENVDKDKLQQAELLARMDQFATDQTVWLTRAATFAEKSRLFPNATFIVGADTVARMLDLKYYASPGACRAGFETIRKQGCRFLAFGRIVDGQFRETFGNEMAEQEVQSIHDLFEWVPESQFRDDVSSSQLRDDPSESDQN